MAEIKYDYTYFHKLLLKQKSLNFERYQHITEKDLLIHALTYEDITEYAAVNWRWISEELYSEEWLDESTRFFNINGELEEFICQIVPREVQVRILTYLRDNCRECLFNSCYDEECIETFETECARLISRNIKESVNDQYHGDFAKWPRPNLKQIAIEEPRKPEYSIMETAFLRGIPNYSENNPLVSKDILLQVAYEFIDRFRASVKAYDESGRDDKLKPIMSYKQNAEIIYKMIIARANRYLYWNRTPVYQVYFLLGCLMGMPDHHRSWHEEKFAEGIGDYLEMTDHFKGSKEKIKNLIQGILTLSQYQLDFDGASIEASIAEQTEQLKQEHEQAHAQRLPKPDEPQPEKATSTTDNSEISFASIIVKNNEKTLKKLHQLIDGHKGKDIGVVLAAAAYKYHVLLRTPTEAEFRKEFPNIQKCSWRSISVWLKKVNRYSDLPHDVQELELDL